MKFQPIDIQFRLKEVIIFKYKPKKIIMTRIKVLLCMAGMIIFLLSACQKIKDTSNAELIIKATEATSLKSASDFNSPSFRSGLNSSSVIILDTFLINIEDIEFEFDESYDGQKGTDDCDDDRDDYAYNNNESEGPYLIDMMSPEALNGMVLDKYTIPNAIYDEIDFDLSVYRKTDNKKMTGRSVYLAGTVNGNRFKLWTNKVKEVEIEFHDHNAVSFADESIRLFIDVSLGKITANIETMNLESAVDGNKNGYIEIGNDDPDGNRALSASLIHSIVGCFDLDDDDFNDDDHESDDNHSDDDKYDGDDDD
jgi:hypothetical protein